MVTPERRVASSKRTRIELAAATHSRRQRPHLNEIKYRARLFHGFGHVSINRMIGGKDRCTVFNAEHGELDMVYVGLRRWCCTEQLGDECRARIQVTSGSVLLALAQMFHHLTLTLGVICPERSASYDSP